MGKHWAIAIGINTYQAFQSLTYAQNDAEALCRYLIDSDRIAPENCLLLTTASALHLGQSTFPLRTTILQWLQWLVDEALQPDDELWVFFCGYGIHTLGADYLMPVDGDPAQADATGITFKEIFQLFKEARTQRILMLLDMNHNEGTLAEPVGIQTAALAHEYGIATLQSCEPQKDQFSREAAGLRHGFFTVALLEALQNPTVDSLKALDQDLRHRMEELSNHYWRPLQSPLTVGEFAIAPAQPIGVGTVSTSTTLGSSILGAGDAITPLDINYIPTSTDSDLGQDFAGTWTWENSNLGGPNGNGNGNANGNSNGSGNSNGNGNSTDPYLNLDNEPGVPTPTGTLDPVSSDSDTNGNLDPYALAWEEDHELDLGNGTTTSNPVVYDYEDGKAGGSNWQWADLVVAPEEGNPGGSLGGSSNSGSNDNSSTTASLIFPEPPPYGDSGSDGALIWSGGSNGIDPGQASPDLNTIDLNTIDIESFGGLIEEDDDGGMPIIELDPLDPEDSTEATTPRPVSTGWPAWLTPRLLWVPGLMLLALLGLWGMFNRGKDNDLDSPPEQLNPSTNPSPSPSNTPSAQGFSTTPSPAPSPSPSTAPSSSASPVPPASAVSPTASASPPPASPSQASSPQASSPQASPSQAETPNASAPPSPALQTAAGLVKPGQASSYNQAIAQARTIPSTDPGYQQARAAMDRWGRDIVAMAEQRANQGDYLGAIAAARLVPPDIAGYPAAQQGISQWQVPSQLQYAKAVVRPGQASSYNQAIAIARGIPRGNATTAEADQLRQAWSREILNIAEQRAKQSQWAMAIAAARLVPPDMEVYPAAQQAITQWQGFLN